MYIERLASQIKNDILSGLRGYHQNLSLNERQLEDEVVQARLAIMREYITSGLISLKDLLVAIDCVDVDCSDLERCRCGSEADCGTPAAHFVIPQPMWDLGSAAINYIGSIDRLNRFNVVTSLPELKVRKYRKRGADKPCVWVDPAPNADGYVDCFVFGAPMLKQVSVVGVFKDPRQVEAYACCSGDSQSLMGQDVNLSAIDIAVRDSIVDKKINYYRSLAAPMEPNDQQYRTAN